MSYLTRMAVSAGLVALVAVGLVSTAIAQGPPDHKVTVCHRTGSGSVVEISVAAPAVKAHMAHGDVIADEYGECP